MAAGPYRHILLNKTNIYQTSRIFTQPTYEVKKIPKANGKLRTIHIPDATTANIGTLLSVILTELTQAYTYEDTGFLGLGCYSYTRIPYAMPRMAHQFKGYKYILHFDIEDFFGTMHAYQIGKRIHDLLATMRRKHGDRKDNTFSLFAKDCALNCCHHVSEGEIPLAVQGSPLTPIISNIVGAIEIDAPLKPYIHSNDTYARFSDDIYVGTNSSDRCKDYGYGVPKIIERVSDFRVNEEKTKVMDKDNPNCLPQVLSLHCDDLGFLKIPSQKGKLMKVAAFKSGSTTYNKHTFKMHLRYKGYLSYVRSINEFNRTVGKPTNTRGAHRQFKGSAHYMEKLEAEMTKSYDQGVKAMLRKNLQLSIDTAVHNGRISRHVDRDGIQTD